MIRKSVFVVMLIRAATVFAAAQLLPEHQQRIGTCPGGGTCAWDCNGSQCEFGFGKQICEIDNDCGLATCLPGPICDGGSRSACELPLLATFPGHLVVRVDDNDALCAPPGMGCNQTTDDDCGSKVTIALRGRKPDASEFFVRKDIDLCATGATACSAAGDCNQCLDGQQNTITCPRPDPVFLCNGQGQTDIREDDVDFGNFSSWLNDIQPVTFLAGSLPADLQTGIPVVLSAAQTASGKFCSGTDPRTTCTQDTDCSGGSCYSEAEYCVTLALIRGRCLGGGANEGSLCATGSECDSGNCGIAGVPDISPLVTDDTDVTVADLGTCGGGCPSSPDGACESAFDKCLLDVDESKPGKEKLVASWQKGPAIVPSAFGNPTVALGTAYEVCAYDQSGTLAGQWTIDRAGATCGDKPCWKALDEGFKYKDKDGVAQGIQSLLLKGDAPGKSKL